MVTFTEKILNGKLHFLCSESTKTTLQTRKSRKIRKIQLKLSSYNLAIITGKWYNIENQKKLCKLLPGVVIGNEIHLLLDCPVYKGLRDHLFLLIVETEEIVKSYGNRFEKLRILFR